MWYGLVTGLDADKGPSFEAAVFFSGVMDMKSEAIKKGIERAPHRSLLYAVGCSASDMSKPFIGVVNSYSEIVPGHIHLRDVAEAVKEGVRAAGGVPFEFNTIAICDGIAMNHAGMKYSLPSRELIADSVETVVSAHAFDGLVCIPNCDKIIPGMLMAAARLNLPTAFVSGGPMLAGRTGEDNRAVDLITVFEAVTARFLLENHSIAHVDWLIAHACALSRVNGTCPSPFLLSQVVVLVYLLPRTDEDHVVLGVCHCSSGSPLRDDLLADLFAVFRNMELTFLGPVLDYFFGIVSGQFLDRFSFCFLILSLDIL